MHEVAFSDAVVQAPVRVLGLTLRNYSIGSEIILVRQRNPLVILSGSQFAVFTPESQTAAIQNAVLVCTRSWKQNQKPQRWLRLWKWKIRNMDHGAAITDFLTYRAAGSTFPPATSDDARIVIDGADEAKKPVRYLGAPFLCRLYSFIVRLPDREIKLFGDTAFDFPLGLGTFLYMTHLEQEGGCQIENEKEAQIRHEFEIGKNSFPAEEAIA